MSESELGSRICMLREKKGMLQKQLAQMTGKVPGWNFNKYLIDRSGLSVTHYPSTVEPESTAFLGQLEKLLAKP